MKIDHGLMSGQVLQRNARDFARTRITGPCTGTGRIQARILRGTRPLRGWNWRTVGTAGGGAFRAVLDRIPTGGPYTVECRLGDNAPVQETLQIPDIRVGDVWFLGGQSNMQGVGLMSGAPDPSPDIRCLYMRDEWAIARDPLHRLGEAVDPVHNNGQRISPERIEAEAREAIRGVGPGLFFAREMLRRTGVPQGLVPCAHGGTAMAAWSPALADQAGRSLYGAMLRRFQRLGQPVRGIVWYQGESDAFPEPALVYTDRMKDLVAATRRDFKQPRLPWILVQIGRAFSATWVPEPWDSIQEQQRLLPSIIPNLEVVPAHDLEMDDFIHIGSRGHALLAGRLALMAERIALGNRRQPPSIRLARTREVYRESPRDPMEFGIELVFNNVVGGLQSPGIPQGFSLLDSDSKPLPMIFKTRFEGNRVILETTLTPSMVFKIGYGLGTSPCCTITDTRDMPLPAFGPIPVGNNIRSAFLIHWMVSGPHNGLQAVSAPYPEKHPGWQPPFTASTSLIMPQNVRQPLPGLFYFRTTVQSDTSRPVKAALGSDSPYRLWINGTLVATNATATNPCNPDQYSHPVELRAGSNELVVAFDGRNGMGWGICLRFFPLPSDPCFSQDAILEIIPAHKP